MRSSQRSKPHLGRAAFTLIEVMIAVTVSTLVLAGAVTFVSMAAKSLSGTATQTEFNARTAYATDFLLSRVRLATHVQANSGGTLLTLGFDDNFSVDSNGDKKAYNDQDHFETFEFRNGDGNDSTLKDNLLVYKPRTNQSKEIQLLRSYARKLPNSTPFVVTNLSTVLVRFGAADEFTGDGYQACDVQVAAVPRNRAYQTTNVIKILP